MAPDLGAYVRRTADLPWVWGVQDCTMWVADWCLERWGMDPAARYRGCYSDEAGAAAILAGGMLAVISPEIPFVPKQSAAEGDIGVIEIVGRQTAAISTGAHWMFRTPRGIGMAVRPALAIWGD